LGRPGGLELLAAAVCQAQEDSPAHTDTAIIGQCSDTLSLLLQRKHKSILGLESIAVHLPPIIDTTAAQVDAAADTAESVSPADIDAAMSPGWENEEGAGTELGESRGPGKKWKGLQSTSRADIKAFLKYVGGQGNRLKALKQRWALPEGKASPSKGGVVELGETDGYELSASTDAADAKKKVVAPEPKLPQAIPAAGVDHMKNLIHSCMANVNKLVSSLAALSTYSRCLEKTKPTADNKWPNLAPCHMLKPLNVAAPEQGSKKEGGTA
jgi:hypothetical protein